MDPKIPAKVRAEIAALVKEKAIASINMKEWKGKSDAAGKQILPLLHAYELKAYSLDGIGTVSAKTARGSAINPEKLKQNLLAAGLKMGRIDAIIKRSSSSWETPYVEFKEAK